MVTGCGHVGIQVSNVDESVQFYEEHLGLTVLSRSSRAEPYVQRLVGYAGVTLEVAVLEIPGSPVRLEIIEYRGVDRARVDTATANPGTAHFCLFVDDLDDLHNSLAASGVDFVSDVETSTHGPFAGGRLVYLKDPDGIRVELVQLP